MKILVIFPHHLNFCGAYAGIVKLLEQLLIT